MAPSAETSVRRSVHIVPVCKTGSFGKQNRLFWKAKQALLGGKTGVFAMSIPLFRHTLIMNELHEVYSCEKHLHFS